MRSFLFYVLGVLSSIDVFASPQTLFWGHVYEVSEPLHKQAVWAAEQIKLRTKGRYDIQVFPVSILGKEAALNESLRLGSVDIIYTGTSFVAQLFPPFALTDLPYIYASYEHWQRFNESDLFDELAKGYADITQGNQILANNYYGARHVTSHAAVLGLADSKNLKIRVPNAAIFKMFPVAIGANPTPIAFSEVYMALQQGVVDAQENPLPTIKAKKLYEVQPHISLTGHMLGSNLSIISQRRWAMLSAEDKDIFSTVLRQAATRVSDETRTIELELVAWFEAQGIQVHQIDTHAFRQATLALHKPYLPIVGRENYQRLLQLNREDK